MAYKLVDREWDPEVNDYRCSFILDSTADASSLPKCCPGSTALVVAKDGAMYMVNASGEWGEL